MAHMTQADWDAHIDAINEFHQDAFQQIITWKKLVTNLSEHGEDNQERHQDIELRGLFLYNYFRSWPTNKNHIAGEVDKESCLLYLNSKYLLDLNPNYINPNGQFNFKPVLDRFVVNGITYKASGESQTAQAGDKPILHFIILKREEINSGSSKY